MLNQESARHLVQIAPENDDSVRRNELIPAVSNDARGKEEKLTSVWCLVIFPALARAGFSHC